MPKGEANAAKTHCAQGHEYSPENTYYALQGKNQTIKRNCRICVAAATKRWYERKKQAQT